LGIIKILKLMNIFQAFWEIFLRNFLECPILNLIVSLNAIFFKFLSQNNKKILTLSQNGKFFKILSQNNKKILTLGLNIKNILILNRSIDKIFNYRLNYF
jgi:hypothetical protein